MIEAKIILDSVNPDGNRLTTWLLTYPRFIHAEFMTHRIFSRNAASSRAIPIEKMAEAVKKNPATFEHVGAANKGMQSHEAAPLGDVFHHEWMHMGRDAAGFALAWSKDVAKQCVNRALEPWSHITVLATATDHSNFFRLRAHPDAQPEFQVLAYRMLAEYVKSKPQLMKWGEWHLPGVSKADVEYGYEHWTIQDWLRMCVARAARASYSRFDDPLTMEDTTRLHDRLRDSGHWSPFEHASQAIKWAPETSEHQPGDFPLAYPWSNFDWPADGTPSGWGQYRKTFPQECALGLDNEALSEILSRRPEWVKI